MPLPADAPVRVADRLRVIHALAAVLLGLALAASLFAHQRLATALIGLALFGQIYSADALRVLILSIREYRR